MYVSVDGDDIGRMLTQRIYIEDDKEVKNFSNKVTNTFKSFENWVKSNSGEILFCAGDSILFKINDNLLEEAIKQLNSDIFTMSIGVGNTLRQAHWALNVAKSLGKNRVVYFDEIRHSILGDQKSEY
jgi:hypothetical protein